MQITLVAQDKLKITLEQKDLLQYQLGYSDLETGSLKTRRLIFQLLAKVKSKYGFNCAGGRLFVEVFPEMSGGCVLYFTILERSSEPDTKPAAMNEKNTVVSLQTVDFQQLLAFAAVAQRACAQTHKQSCLYKTESQYVLLITIESAAKQRWQRFFQEFEMGELAREHQLYYYQEHARLLIAENALTRLAALK